MNDEMVDVFVQIIQRYMKDIHIRDRERLNTLIEKGDIKTLDDLYQYGIEVKFGINKDIQRTGR